MEYDPAIVYNLRYTMWGVKRTNQDIQRKINEKEFTTLSYEFDMFTEFLISYDHYKDMYVGYKQRSRLTREQRKDATKIFGYLINNEEDYLFIENILKLYEIAIEKSLRSRVNSLSPFVKPDDHYTGRVDPYTGYVDTYTGYVDPYTGRVDPYTGRVDPYTGHVDPYTGRVDSRFNIKNWWEGGKKSKKSRKNRKSRKR